MLSKIYITSILTIGIDNNLGLWNGVIQPFKFKLMNFFGVIIPVHIVNYSFFNFLILKYSDKKIYNVIIVFLVTIFIFNLFDQTKSYTKIKIIQTKILIINIKKLT